VQLFRPSSHTRMGMQQPNCCNFPLRGLPPIMFFKCVCYWHNSYHGACCLHLGGRGTGLTADSARRPSVHVQCWRINVGAMVVDRERVD
jgi:hypothetical protein